MNNGLIASRYATALLGFAENQKLEKEFFEIAKTLSKSFATHAELNKVLENPVVDGLTKKKILLTASATKNASFSAFIELLISNKREVYTQRIMLRFLDVYRRKNQILSGKLITASELDSVTEKRMIAVIEKSTNGSLEIEKELDSSLIGGFILEVDNTRWDASIKRQLQTLKNELNF